VDIEHDLVGKSLVEIQNVFWCSNEDDMPFVFLLVWVGAIIIPH